MNCFLTSTWIVWYDGVFGGRNERENEGLMLFFSFIGLFISFFFVDLPIVPVVDVVNVLHVLCALLVVLPVVFKWLIVLVSLKMDSDARS